LKGVFSILKKGANRQTATIALWALLVAALAWLPGDSPLSQEESRLLQRIETTWDSLLVLRSETGVPHSETDDPQRSGMIGVEWSTITTTSGSLASKQLSVRPAWAVVFRRWLAREGLGPGDKVTILSSGSFPGLAVSSLSAAESLDLDVTLVISLGSSTWGANIPSMTICDILHFLRTRGFVRTRAAACTIGGAGEMGKDLPPEGLSALEEAARRGFIPLIAAKDLEEMIERKAAVSLPEGTRLVIQIGGSNADLGSDPSLLDLPPGFLRPSPGLKAGNGVVSKALERGITVLHILNIPELARSAGLEGRSSLPWERSPWRFLVAAASGMIVLSFFRRWEFK